MPESDSVNTNVSNDTVDPKDLDQGIDLDALAAKIGISAKHMPKLLNGFLVESEQNAELLEKAAAQKDFQEMARLAHSIKGSSGNLMFDTLYERAKSIESAAESSEDHFPYVEESKEVKIYLNKIKQMIS